MNTLLTAIPGVMVIESQFKADSRGSFGRLFCEQELAALLEHRHIVQINHSRTSTAGTVRGLHYQHPPHAEMKFVRCLRGRVWDVAVDLRRDSATFLHWHAEELTPQNARMLVIPEACAHGFQVLEPDSELLYLHTAAYAADCEGGVAYSEPRLAIDWPLPVIQVSPRDVAFGPLGADYCGLLA